MWPMGHAERPSCRGGYNEGIDRGPRCSNAPCVVVKTMDCSSPHDDHPLSVTLSWYDPPGASNCAHCLINDLDLSVEKVGSRQK
mmetsp:Transcript_1143/g.1729  ORF Transcript_1143/g.1729 Transcript_1143/m.1729 type:complete len:84 (+) Transcript_1143:495-746(+)